jgi:putative tryptophan/tyrosine transport system substrate-binding protein
MRRRAFVTGVASAASWPVIGLAQQPARTARIGRLSPLSEASEKPMIDGLRAGLKELGWTEGRNLTLELRFADGDPLKLPALAAELVARQVDVIVTGSNPGALAAKAATDRIPIVFVTTGDPIAGGLVSSLGRPGGNLTGITALGVELTAKRLELLKEGFGGLRRIAALTNPGSPYTDEFNARKDATARTLGIELATIEVRDPADLAAAFDRLRAENVGGVLVLADIMFISHRRQIVDLVAASRMPAIYPDRAFVDVGGLLFYGAALPDMYRHAAIYVDKILRGAKPADLPIEQPTKFELTVNLKTAKALGIEIPPTLLARADEVIE